MKNNFVIQNASWEANGEALRYIRECVFMKEQDVPEELELDGLDDGSIHLLASDMNGRPIGTARLLPDGQIGRMAVLPEWRSRGVGSALLEKIIETARSRGLKQVKLDAQDHAVGFYEQHGFSVEGEEFLDAGIPHRRMTMIL